MADRPPAATWAPLLAAAAALVTVLLGLPFAGEHVPGALDRAIAGAVHDVLGGQQALLRMLTWPTEPIVLIALVAGVLTVCLLDGDRTGALLAVAAPPVAIALNTWLLKPLFGRYYDDHLAYPSGHTVSLVAVLTVLALLARPGLATWLAAVLGAVLVLGAGIGMIGLGYHYATDILGGCAFAIAVVLASLAVLSRARTRAVTPARSDR